MQIQTITYWIHLIVNVPDVRIVRVVWQHNGSYFYNDVTKLIIYSKIDQNYMDGQKYIMKMNVNYMKCKV